jgi:hypothetical protein
MKRIILTWLALCTALFGAWQLEALGVPHFKSLHVERLLVSPAQARPGQQGGNGCQTPGLNISTVFCGGGVNPATATFESHSTTSNSGGVTTSGSMAAGSPNPADVMLAAICGRGSSYTVTGVTYNTNAKTQVSGAAQTGSMSSDFWYITGSGNAGSTATMAVTWSNAAIARALVSLYKIITATTTPTTATGTIATATSISTGITVQNNGVGVANVCYQAPATPAFTAGATADDTLTSTNAILVGQAAGSGASITVSANGNNTGNTIAESLVAFAHD